MYFLRIGDDFLEDAVGFETLKSACNEFEDIAAELHMYGQNIEASIHIAPSIGDVVEYPDYVLSYNGRVIVELI